MNLMQRGAVFLGQNMQASAGRSIIYKRGSHETAAITAWNANQEYDAEDANGVTTTIAMDDWTVFAEDLAFNGAQLTPRAGDVITETLNGVTIEYQVLPVAGRKAVEWLDTSGILLLIHTKRVGA